MKVDNYIMSKGFHPVHFEALKLEKIRPSRISFKGTTQVIYRFPNGYGASVIKGELISFGLDEMAVMKFPKFPHNRPPRTKRLKKKYSSREMIGDPVRFSDKEELEQRLLDIKRGVFQ